MSPSTTMEPHIAYELIDDTRPEVVAIEFLNDEIVGPVDARELGEQLHSLVSPEVPQRFVLDFGNIQTLGGTAFGEIVSFARKVGRLYICNMQENLQPASALNELEDCAEFAASRTLAIDWAKRANSRGEANRSDFPLHGFD